MIAAPFTAGVDEAGRGPLAGPVVAAAVILCPTTIQGLADSKVLTAPKRAILSARIRERCQFGIGLASVEEIDAINIFQATMLAMTRAVAALCEKHNCEPSDVLIDGNMTPHGRRPEWRWPARAIVKGDATERCISAASIVAKEHRDAIMLEAAQDYPHYAWERNKGYGTAAHLAALREHGPTPLHRRSFAPVAQLLLI